MFSRSIFLLLCLGIPTIFLSASVDDDKQVKLLLRQLDEKYRSLPEAKYQKAALEMRWIGYCYGVVGSENDLTKEEISNLMEQNFARRIIDRGEADPAIIFELGEYLRKAYPKVYALFSKEVW